MCYFKLYLRLVAQPKAHTVGKCTHDDVFSHQPIQSLLNPNDKLNVNICALIPWSYQSNGGAFVVPGLNK